MIHHFTIGCWILLFFSPQYVPVFANGKVIRVPRGLDATLHCRSETSFPPKWEWDARQTINPKEIVVNSTAYLLVENFQKINEGRYHCFNGAEKKSTVKLELQQGIKDGTLVYRSTESGSLHLSCEALSSAKLEGFWSRRQTGSGGPCKGSGTDLVHFGNRYKVKNGLDNTFSLSISPLHWNDSGRYRCTLCNDSKYYRQCAYEIITAQVYSLPMKLTEGEDGSLVCAVSHVNESIRFLWIDVQNQQMFPSPEESKSVSEFRLSVRNITWKQNAWACAVFHLDHLRALLPINLTKKELPPPQTELSAGEERINVSDKAADDQTETLTQIPIGYSQIYYSLICFTGLLLSLGTFYIVYWCWIHKGGEQTSDDDVNYAELNMKKKKAAASSPAVSAIDNLTTGGDSVIYSEVAV